MTPSAPFEKSEFLCSGQTEQRHQEWSPRLNSTRHRKPHQVVTALSCAAWPFSVGRVICLVSSARTNWQIDSSFLILWVVVHGRSSLVESFVLSIPFLCVRGKREIEREGEREREEMKMKRQRWREKKSEKYWKNWENKRKEKKKRRKEKKKKRNPS